MVGNIEQFGEILKRVHRILRSHLVVLSLWPADASSRHAKAIFESPRDRSATCSDFKISSYDLANVEESYSLPCGQTGLLISCHCAKKEKRKRTSRYRNFPLEPTLRRNRERPRKASTSRSQRSLFPFKDSRQSQMAVSFLQN